MTQSMLDARHVSLQTILARTSVMERRVQGYVPRKDRGQQGASHAIQSPKGHVHLHELAQAIWKLFKAGGCFGPYLTPVGATAK